MGQGWHQAATGHPLPEAAPGLEGFLGRRGSAAGFLGCGFEWMDLTSCNLVALGDGWHLLRVSGARDARRGRSVDTFICSTRRGSPSRGGSVDRARAVGTSEHCTASIWWPPTQTRVPLRWASRRHARPSSWAEVRGGEDGAQQGVARTC